MEPGDSEKPRGTASGKITAAHLAGLRPRPEPTSPIGKWDTSTAFVAGFAFATLTVPELHTIFGAASADGAPYSAGDLIMLLGFVACFGIFPIIILQHLYLQNICKRPNFGVRFLSAAVALALIFVATGAMKPLVGYDQKVAENSRIIVSPTIAKEHANPARTIGDISRSPASIPAESGL